MREEREGARGFGTRIGEESYLRPKPIIEIGGRRILWHIMKVVSAYGVQAFVVCCGYNVYLIKEYFVNDFLHRAYVGHRVRHDAGPRIIPSHGE